MAHSKFRNQGRSQNNEEA